MRLWHDTLPAERNISTIKEAVQLLNEESLEKFTLVYLHNYIVYNNHLDYSDRLNKIYEYKRRVKEIRKSYRYKRIVFEEYRSMLADLYNELTSDDFIDEVVAICIGFYKYENFSRWHRHYKAERMYDELEEEFEDLENENLPF